MQDVINRELYQAAQYESNAAAAKYDVELERKRPFYLLQPEVFADGNQWCCLLGKDIQVGVCGFGDTPAAAAVAFDLAWLNAKAPRSNQNDYIA